MTLLSSAIMALLTTIFCGVILLTIHDRAVDSQTNRILLADLRAVHLILVGQLPRVLPDDGIAAIQVIDPAGRIVAANKRMVGKPRMASLSPPGDSMRADQVDCNMPEFPGRCMLVVAIKVHDGGGYWIIYGADRVIPWYIRPSVLAILLIGSALLVGATAIGAYRTVSKALDPVDAVRAELAEITSTDLGRRVPVPEHHDEIRAVAVTVNQTLDRLEEAVEQQRRFAEQQQRFTSDASHDLRSPITAMRTHVEEAMMYPDETNWPATAQALLASLDRLEAIVTDLLVLARLDAGAPSATYRLDLSELVSSEIVRRAPHVAVVTNLEPGLVVTADRLQLGRLLTNLLDNAARHAASTVTVSARREGDEAIVEVVDDGPGISPEQREVVFQRFARLDAARDMDKGGTGLGLAIARQIAERHGGTLTIEDSEQGARFVLRIPVDVPEQAG
jgi:signal transduction histidine kinase